MPGCLSKMLRWQDQTRWMDLDLYQGSAMSAKQLSLHEPCVRSRVQLNMVPDMHHYFQLHLFRASEIQTFSDKKDCQPYSLSKHAGKGKGMNVWVPKRMAVPQYWMETPLPGVMESLLWNMWIKKKFIWCKVKGKSKIHSNKNPSSSWQLWSL